MEIVVRLAPETISGSGTVLVVDDDSVVRDIAGAMLSKLGYNAFAAAGGNEALRIYAEKKGKRSGAARHDHA